MATYGGFNFTGFKGVNLKNTAAIRLEGDNGCSGTLSIRPGIEANKAWYLPDKAGGIGITGTFEVNLPAVSANDIHGTNVAVSGIRAEDAMVCSMQNMTTTGMSERGYVFLGGCEAGNGGVNLTFVNAGATATVYKDVVLAYTAVR